MVHLIIILKNCDIITSACLICIRIWAVLIDIKKNIYKNACKKYENKRRGGILYKYLGINWPDEKEGREWFTPDPEFLWGHGKWSKKPKDIENVSKIWSKRVATPELRFPFHGSGYQ